MKRFSQVFLILFCLALACCADIKMISRGINKDLYSESFLTSIENIKTQYRRGNVDVALSQLQTINEAELEPAEKAMRRNLIGVIYFGKQNFEQAIFNFNQALANSQEDENLTSQIKLNLASSYYRLKMNEEAYKVLKDAPFKTLTPAEIVKFHILRYRLANEMEDNEAAMNSLVWTLSQKDKISELRIDSNYEVLLNKFRQLEQREKYRFLEKYADEKFFVIGYLSYLEAEKVYYSGDKGSAEDLIGWTDRNFSQYPEIKTLIKNFTYKVENYAKLDATAIGVVLPLSGDKADYGRRALLGIDAALRKFQEQNPELPKFNVIIKDSKGSGVVGAHHIKELVEKNYVAAIIGGLFSNEATKEFEVAKKSGAFFVSLSQIYADKEDKDHLLLEVPGSIESQVDQLLSSNIVKNFGPRAAVVYPDSKRGRAYVNEFWRKSNLLNLPVVGLYNYEKKPGSFSEPIKNLLGLKFPRIRQEEFELLEEIHSLEGARSTRRVQTLPPQVDFDWVFIPAYPLEAVQIIPTFTYYDAFSIPIVGGPSWRSQRLSKESYKFRNIFFVGDDVQEVSSNLAGYFKEKYDSKLRLIELRSFDSMGVALNLLSNKVYESRDELDMAIRGLGQIQGQTGSWSLRDGIWLKQLASLHLRNGKISEVALKEKEPEGKVQ